jgi:hypothetical protein
MEIQEFSDHNPVIVTLEVSEEEGHALHAPYSGDRTSSIFKQQSLL